MNWLRFQRMIQEWEKNHELVKILNDYKEETSARSLTFEEVSNFLKNKKDYVVSYKLDGELNALLFENGKSKIFSRVGRVRRYFPVTDEADKLLSKNKKVIAFGELHVVDSNGIPISYPNAISILRKPETEEDEKNIRFAVFDLFEVDGKNKFDKNYWKRMEEVKELFGKGKYVYPVVVEKDGIELVKKMWKEVTGNKGYEGLVITLLGNGIEKEKRIKVKPLFSQDLCVIAIEYSPEHKWMSNLMLAYIDRNHNYRYAGHVGTGFTENERKEWYRFANINKVKGPKSGTSLIWINPLKTHVVEIKSEELRIQNTPQYKFEKNIYIDIGKAKSAVGRKPVFIRIREDKEPNPEDCRLEQIPNF